jgi:hypothetical protein
MRFGSPSTDGNDTSIRWSQTKMILTNGAITKKNYTDSKSGKVGDFHHTLGSIVEIKDDETFFVRQVTADDKSGDFSDLYNRVKDGNEIRLYSCVILGDIHYGHHDQRVLDTTMGLLDILKPTCYFT